MRTSAILLILAAGILIGSPLAAQDPVSIFATYYRCDQSRETDLDPVIAGAFARVLDPLVEAGRIGGHSWRPHVAGTAWRRLATYTAPSRRALLEVRADIIKQAQEEQGAFAMLNEICPSHDDYIWTLVASSPTVADALPDADEVGLSLLQVRPGPRVPGGRDLHRDHRPRDPGARGYGAYQRLGLVDARYWR